MLKMRTGCGVRVFVARIMLLSFCDRILNQNHRIEKPWMRWQDYDYVITRSLIASKIAIAMQSQPAFSARPLLNEVNDVKVYGQTPDATYFLFALYVFPLV